MTHNQSSGSIQAQTVLGPVDADRLGIILPHEHLLIDMKIWFSEPAEASQKHLAHEPVRLENLYWINYNQYANLDNVRLLDEELAIREARIFKAQGGGTIVDVTTDGLGRDPLALARISRMTGLNIVMGCGCYVGTPQDKTLTVRTEDEIADEITGDILNGVRNTGVRAGIIGEIGCSWPLSDPEKKVLRACAATQRRTGAAITIHPGRHENSPLEIVRTLADAGADISRVVMGHMDRTGFTLEAALAIAKTGCCMEYDTFGPVPFYPLRFGVFNRPCDRERIEQIMALMDAGYLHNILISQDVCLKTKLVQYGGGGYAHILRNIVPQMLARKMTPQEIHTIMEENPRRILGFLKAKG